MQVMARTTEEIAVLDQVDREIVGHLVRNARMSYRELGERVALSANATAERVRRLVRRGGHRRASAPSSIPPPAGRTLVALIDVRLDGPADSERFERLIESLEEVTDAAHVTGRFDYQLRVACRDVNNLDQVIGTLKRKGGAQETDTRLALRTVVRRAA